MIDAFGGPVRNAVAEDLITMDMCKIYSFRRLSIEIDAVFGTSTGISNDVPENKTAQVNYSAIVEAKVH